MTSPDQKHASDGSAASELPSTSPVRWSEDGTKEPWYEGWGEEAEEPTDVDSSLPKDAPVEAAPAPEPEANDQLADDGGGRRRSKTIARKQMLRERRRMLAQGTVPEIIEYERPGTREACRNAKRPCLYVSCRYHLYLDVNPVTGSIKLNFPDKQIYELAETCALDVAERGGITLEEVGEIMNLTRERIRQVEVTGLEKLKTGDVSLHTFVDGRELELPEPSEPSEE